ncbi:hypothetical protein [Rhizobium sp. LjRoot254]|uniref:hypothetical protein n=1 Tax=Rhizobium sp. LjRoot254 TaxID=3342297 RepID=UPI003ECDF478
MTGTEFIENLSQHLPDDVLPLIEGSRPVDTLLLADIGELIAHRFDELNDPAGLFRLVEEAVVNGDDYLATAVLTGLVEQVQTVADGTPKLWPQIVPYLGEHVARHAAAMNTFFGINAATSPSS